jgi:hypothetical protein
MGWTAPAIHPILACAQTIENALVGVVEVDPLYMSPTDQAEALRAVQRDLNRLEALQLRLLAAAEDMAAADGARDPAAWIAHHTRLDRRDARRRQELAQALHSRWRRLAEALADGLVTSDQAQVIATALDDLPCDLDPVLREQAEKHLIGLAGDHDPRELRILGRKVLEVIAPEVAEDHEHAKLAGEEKQARKRTWLRFRNAGDGTTYLNGRLPTPLADRLRSYLDAFASPRRPTNRRDRTHRPGDQATPDAAPGSPDPSPDPAQKPSEPTPGETAAPSNPDHSPYDARLGRAFCSLLEQWDPNRLPIHGGAATTVMITIDLDQLRRDLGIALTDTGETITADEARRLACTAGIVPAVLGTDSQPLDLGRTTRLFTAAQRTAMALRDRTCRAEGCTIPATWSEAHHLVPWAEGGRTDLDAGVLLCSWHHHRAHDPTYTNQRLPNGDLRFHRRT